MEDRIRRYQARNTLSPYCTPIPSICIFTGAVKYVKRIGSVATFAPYDLAIVNNNS